MCNAKNAQALQSNNHKYRKASSLSAHIYRLRVLGHISLIASPSFASLVARMFVVSVQHLLWLVATVPVDDGTDCMRHLLLAGSAPVLETHSVPTSIWSWTSLRLRSSIFIKRNTLIAPLTPVKDHMERRYLKTSASTNSWQPSTRPSTPRHLGQVAAYSVLNSPGSDSNHCSPD